MELVKVDKTFGCLVDGLGLQPQALWPKAAPSAPPPPPNGAPIRGNDAPDAADKGQNGPHFVCSSTHKGKNIGDHMYVCIYIHIFVYTVRKLF
jgi:hypothetical protein